MTEADMLQRQAELEATTRGEAAPASTSEKVGPVVPSRWATWRRRALLAEVGWRWARLAVYVIRDLGTE